MFWLVLILVLDQITKYIATLYLQGQIKILSGFFIFTYATNTGVAFGLLAGVKEIVIYLTLLIVVAMSIIPTFIEMKKSTQMFFAFILGGALGNLIDRIRFGYVVDFITMIHWPTVFNIADMSIMFGSIGLVIQMLIAESKAKARMEKVSNRREDSGHTGDKQGKWLAARQIRARENTGVDLQNVHTESDKERRSAGEWNFQEAESQGEVWGYNYIGDARQTDTTTDRTGEHTA